MNNKCFPYFQIRNHMIINISEYVPDILIFNAEVWVIFMFVLKKFTSYNIIVFTSSSNILQNIQLRMSTL